MTYKGDLEEAKRRHRRAEALIDAATVVYGLSCRSGLAEELVRLASQVMDGSIEWDVGVFIAAQSDRGNDV